MSLRRYRVTLKRYIHADETATNLTEHALADNASVPAKVCAIAALRIAKAALRRVQTVRRTLESKCGSRTVSKAYLAVQPPLPWYPQAETELLREELQHG